MSRSADQLAAAEDLHGARHLEGRGRAACAAQIRAPGAASRRRWPRRSWRQIEAQTTSHERYRLLLSPARRRADRRRQPAGAHARAWPDEARPARRPSGRRPVRPRLRPVQGPPLHRRRTRRPRRMLYLAALSAKRHDPASRPSPTACSCNGKPPKVVIVAVMRRLIEAANLVLARGQPWAQHAPA